MVKITIYFVYIFITCNNDYRRIDFLYCMPRGIWYTFYGRHTNVGIFPILSEVVMIIKEIKEFRLTEEEKSAIIAIAKAVDNANTDCQQVDCTRCPLHVIDYNEQIMCFSCLAKQIIGRGVLRDY